MPADAVRFGRKEPTASGFSRACGMSRVRNQVAVGLPLLILIALACGGFPGNLGLTEGSRKAAARKAEQDKWDERFHNVTQMERVPVALAPLVASGREWSSFPSPENSTILFLHVFKCAGTSLREVFMSLAKHRGWTGAIVLECKAKQALGFGVRGDTPTSSKICLNERNDLMDTLGQKWQVAGQKVLAGHFMWNFREYVTPPYLHVTTLRNPLELFVSSQQFKHRTETKTLKSASDYVAEAMLYRLERKDPTDVGFIRRFLDIDGEVTYNFKTQYTQEQFATMASTAVEHLNTFLVVGVVEQYRGFIEVLKHVLDPRLQSPHVWEKAVEVKSNGSPVHSLDVLERIDPELVRHFNSTALVLQWQVYDVALKLWDARCREVLPPQVHAEFCPVPPHNLHPA